MSRPTPLQLDVIASLSTFGDLLRYLRQRRQLTQRDLALATGYSISQISRLEHNKRLPDEMTLLAVFVPALGLEQEPATVQQLLALARQARDEVAAPPAPPATIHEPARPDPAKPPPTPKLTNLPYRLTSFIGREQDVLALQTLVQGNRLVTLTGVGGVGKSSLALAVADTLTFPDGVWLLELAPLTEGGLVARTLADLFKLPEFPGRTPLEALITYLQHKELLLIVDNCEHLIATCADLVERLLQAAPKLQIVATSREALNIAGEREWPVAPLSTPPDAPTDGAIWSFPQLQPFAAAQLFIERAQEAKAGLVFADQDAPLIAQLCQQLDGIPLVLELAAARCKSLTLQEIVVRLHDRFTLLSAGQRTALLRHQTLRATIDWSYDLLSPAEAALLRALSVFVGGWTLEAAEQVADRAQGQPPTFDLLHQLVNKSLVIVDQQGEMTRYRMLETIRQYASEKLQEQGEKASMCEQHAAYFMQLAEQARPLLYGAEQQVWYQRLIDEQSNFRMAMQWWRANHQYAAVAQLSAALCWFWWKHGDMCAEAHWAEWALSAMDRQGVTTPIAIRAKGLYAVAFSAECLGNWSRARVLYEEYLQIQPQPYSFIDSYEVLRQLANLLAKEGDCDRAGLFDEQRLALSHTHDFQPGVADALMQLGSDALAQGDTGRAKQLLQESLLLHKTVGLVTGVAQTQAMLGVVACRQGDYTQALLLFQEVLERCYALDDKHGIGWTFSDLGVVAQLQQRYAEATCYQHRALTLARELGYQHMVALVLGRLGNLALIQDDGECACSYYLESLALYQQIGLPRSSAAGLEGLAGVEALNRHPRDAVYLLGAAEACRQARGIVIAIEQQAIHERTVTLARAALGDAQFEAAHLTGQTTLLDDLIPPLLAHPRHGLQADSI